METNIGHTPGTCMLQVHGKGFFSALRVFVSYGTSGSAGVREFLSRKSEQMRFFSSRIESTRVEIGFRTGIQTIKQWKWEDCQILKATLAIEERT